MSIDRISLYHLETLVCISQLGTFAAAAERLNTTQPAVSARVTELQDRLGMALFQRSGRNMILTPEGRKLVQDYLPVWEKLRGILLRTAEFEQLSGVVRIGVGEIAAATCLPPFVAEQRISFPGLIFEIDVELTAQLIHGVLTGKFDFALAAGSIAHPVLKSTSVGAAKVLWVASPQIASGLRPDAVQEHLPFWSLPGHSPLYGAMRQALAEHGLPDQSISLCNNLRTMIDIVMMGGGLALVPEAMVRDHIRGGQLVPVLEDVKVEPIAFQIISRLMERDPVVVEILRRADGMDLGAGSYSKNGRGPESDM